MFNNSQLTSLFGNLPLSNYSNIRLNIRDNLVMSDAMNMFPLELEPEREQERESEREDTPTVEKLEMKLCENRLNSFSFWSPTHPIKPHQFARAGFFYTGYGEIVKCFSCGLELCDFKTYDDILDEHIRWNPECKYLKIIYCHEKPNLERDITSNKTNVGILKTIEMRIKK